GEKGKRLRGPKVSPFSLLLSFPFSPYIGGSASNINFMHITSRDNSLLRQARAVRDGKTKDLIFVEGLRLCEEAFRSKLSLESIIYSTQLAKKERAADAIEQLAGVAKRAASV